MKASEAVESALSRVPGYADLPEEERNRVAAQLQRDMQESQTSGLRPWLLALLLISLLTFTYLYASVLPGFDRIYMQWKMTELPLLTEGLLRVACVTRFLWALLLFSAAAIAFAAVWQFWVQKPTWRKPELLIMLGVLVFFALSVAGVYAAIMPMFGIQATLSGG